MSALRSSSLALTLLLATGSISCNSDQLTNDSPENTIQMVISAALANDFSKFKGTLAQNGIASQTYGTAEAMLKLTSDVLERLGKRNSNLDITIHDRGVVGVLGDRVVTHRLDVTANQNNRLVHLFQATVTCAPHENKSAYCSIEDIALEGHAKGSVAHRNADDI